jgi:hypothetical protein
LGIESIAADPVKPDRVYMAVGMYSQSWAGLGTMLRSDDRGGTFTQFEIPINGRERGRALERREARGRPAPAEDPVLRLAPKRSLEEQRRSRELEESRNAPATMDDKGLGISFVAFDPRSKAGEPTCTLYVGVSRLENHLFRSTDAGETWQSVPGRPTAARPGKR